MFKGRVVSARHTAVLLPADQLDARIVEGVDDIPHSYAAVLYKEQFPVLIGLRDKALNRSGEGLPSVVGTDKHTDQGAALPVGRAGDAFPGQPDAFQPLRIFFCAGGEQSENLPFQALGRPASVRLLTDKIQRKDAVIIFRQRKL